MQRITCVPLVLMGNNLAALMTQLFREGIYTYNDLARDAHWLIQSLEQWGADTIFSGISSKAEAIGLAATLKEKTGSDFLKENGTKELDQKEGLILTIQHFTNSLFFDLNLAESYMITQKRDRNMSILIYSAEQALSRRTIEQLSESCLKDIKEAGRCLAFDLPTACGFHIFRALETVVLMYFPVLYIPYPDEKRRNLGTYILLLRGANQYGNKDAQKNLICREGALKVNNKITGMLTHLKDVYRNPLIHPEVTLTDDEAVSTFQFAISAIDVMVHDIIEWKAVLAANVCQ